MCSPAAEQFGFDELKPAHRPSTSRQAQASREVVTDLSPSGNLWEPPAATCVFVRMERDVVSEQIEALRVEALEARCLAETLGDVQSIADLENYAAQLEAEAERLSSHERCTADNVSLKLLTVKAQFSHQQ
jgi:hypothetical protein